MRLEFEVKYRTGSDVILRHDKPQPGHRTVVWTVTGYRVTWTARGSVGVRYVLRSTQPVYSGTGEWKPVECEASDIELTEPAAVAGGYGPPRTAAEGGVTPEGSETTPAI